MEPSSSPYQNMLPELGLHVLSFLDYRSLIAANRVCRDWNDIANDKLWKRAAEKVNLVSEALPQEDFKRTVQEFPITKKVTYHPNEAQALRKILATAYKSLDKELLTAISYSSEAGRKFTILLGNSSLLAPMFSSISLDPTIPQKMLEKAQTAITIVGNDTCDGLFKPTMARSIQKPKREPISAVVSVENIAISGWIDPVKILLWAGAPNTDPSLHFEPKETALAVQNNHGMQGLS